MSYKEFAYPKGGYGGIPSIERQAPGMVLFVNFPPDPNPDFRGLFALFCPVFTMFKSPNTLNPSADFELIPMIKEQERLGDKYFPSAISGYKKTIVIWFPKTRRPMAYPGRGDWTLKEMGLQRGSTAEDYGLYTPDFITYGTRYAESTPEGEGTQSYLLYEDSGNANQQDFLKSKCFLNAIDSKMSTVYKAETIREWMNGNKEKEDVKGLINRMWKLSAGDANTSPSLVVGGIMTVNPVTILYKTGRSVFSKNDLEPPPGQTPEEYETVVSNLLIENAIKINILFNLLQDFKEVNPNDPQPIPPNLKIEIGGHTDKVGVRSNFDNISLSKKRAEGIVNFLKSKSPELTSFCSPIKVKDLLTPRLKPKGYGFEECTTGNDVRNDGARKVSFRIVASDD